MSVFDMICHNRMDSHWLIIKALINLRPGLTLLHQVEVAFPCTSADMTVLFGRFLQPNIIIQ